MLLLRFHIDAGRPGSGHGWVAPGGGIEDGETPAEAAARELREEIGLCVEPGDLGPQIAETSGCTDLGPEAGLLQDNFFHYRVTSHQVDDRGQQPHERTYGAGHRWWTFGELAASTETVYPVGLAGLLADLLAGRVPDRPVRLPWRR